MVLQAGKNFWDCLSRLANRQAKMHADEYKSHPPTPTFMLSLPDAPPSTRRRLAPQMAAGSRLNERQGYFTQHFQAGKPVIPLVSFKEIQ
jgi:hypothetical protein